MEAEVALIVADMTDDNRRAERLWAQPNELMADDTFREQVDGNCRKVAKKDAALKIAEQLVEAITVLKKRICLIYNQIWEVRLKPIAMLSGKWNHNKLKITS